jgi:hypothetical protein
MSEAGGRARLRRADGPCARGRGGRYRKRHMPVAVIHTPVPPRRTISECIALAKNHEEETGEAPVLDADFAADVEEILRNRKPWNPPAWE